MQWLRDLRDSDKDRLILIFAILLAFVVVLRIAACEENIAEERTKQYRRISG